MLSPSDFPPVFSADVLRRRYSDLETYDDAFLASHYVQYGRDEGRVASDGALREVLISLIDPDSAILEIGPFCQPVFRGPNVRYLDVLDAQQLRARAGEIGEDASGCPDVIHFTNGLAEASGSNLDVVFSSHNIEHQPDLIRHLNEVAAALRPGGFMVMLVPDKRYCFDHFLAETTIAEVVESFLDRRSTHTVRHVVEHVALTAHNDTARHWAGDHGVEPNCTDGRLTLAINRLQEAGDAYIDVHAWKFTPTSFSAVIGALSIAGIHPMRIERVYDTPAGRNEFGVVLRAPGG